MKREILFRGLRTDGKGWVEGRSLIQYEEQNRVVIEHTAELEFRQWEVTPETVGQFTGIHDKNGKRIFEDDVVRIYENKAQVIFQDGSFKFVTKNTNGDFLSWRYCREEIEIIGNIYEP